LERGGWLSGHVVQLATDEADNGRKDEGVLLVQALEYEDGVRLGGWQLSDVYSMVVASCVSYSSSSGAITVSHFS